MEFRLFFLMQRDEGVRLSRRVQSRPRADAGNRRIPRLFLRVDRRASLQRLRALPALKCSRRTSPLAPTRLRLGMGVASCLAPPGDGLWRSWRCSTVVGGRLDIGIGRERLRSGTTETFQSDRADSRERVEEDRLVHRGVERRAVRLQGRFHSAELLRARHHARPHPPLYRANSEDVCSRRASTCRSRRSSSRSRELQRRRIYRETAAPPSRTEPEIAALERQGWGMRVVYVARGHDEALQATEAPFMAISAGCPGPAVGRCRRLGRARSIARCCACARLQDYLADGWALIGYGGRGHGQSDLRRCREHDRVACPAGAFDRSRVAVDAALRRRSRAEARTPPLSRA